jgi:hypothetical protein
MQSPTRQGTPPKRLRPSREGGSRYGDGAQTAGEKCRLGFEKAAEIMRADLERILGLCSRRSVRLVLLTYAAYSMPEYPETRHLRRNETMTDTMLAFGRANEISVVDVRDRFSHLLAEGTPREVYFSSRKGAHPNARGYAEIAVAVADLLERPAPTNRPPTGAQTP